ncbi:MAG: amidohydrolase family protein [Bacteroidales bacterium]
MKINDQFHRIFEKIQETPFIDTHEHFIDESERLNCLKPFIQCDDWTTIFGLYSKFDFVSAGMPKSDVGAFTSSEIHPIDKWKIIEPYWHKVKYTGSGQVIQNTIKELYHIPQLSLEIIPELEEKYQAYRKKGFYKETLRKANVKSCIVNPPGRPFKETELPEILYQDINALGMININVEQYNESILPKVSTLRDWLHIIDWWFEKYSNQAVGVKIGNAYFRRLDFNRTDLETVEPLFQDKLSGIKLSELEEKQIQDYIFWYVVELATQKGLPIKLHTGYQAMNNMMILENVMHNPADCANLCRLSPDARFIFFHISYPYYEPMIALAKHYKNAFIDMCWSWTLNPMASIDFLKKYILTAPVNKLLVFGGDDLYIENLMGHSILARKGIAHALSELVQDQWISERDSMEIAERIMYKNTEEIYAIGD